MTKCRFLSMVLMVMAAMTVAAQGGGEQPTDEEGQLPTGPPVFVSEDLQNVGIVQPLGVAPGGDSTVMTALPTGAKPEIFTIDPDGRAISEPVSIALFGVQTHPETQTNVILSYAPEESKAEVDYVYQMFRSKDLMKTEAREAEEIAVFDPDEKENKGFSRYQIAHIKPDGGLHVSQPTANGDYIKSLVFSNFDFYFEYADGASGQSRLPVYREGLRIDGRILVEMDVDTIIEKIVYYRYNGIQEEFLKDKIEEMKLAGRDRPFLTVRYFEPATASWETGITYPLNISSGKLIPGQKIYLEVEQWPLDDRCRCVD